MTGRWAGRKVTSARAHWRVRLPLPCRRCARMVTAEQAWTVGHIVDRALGGGDDVSNQWPEHAHCNYAAGGQLGHAMTKARKSAGPVAAGSMSAERDRGIRGV